MKGIFFILLLSGTVPKGFIPPALEEINLWLFPSLYFRIMKIHPLQSVYEPPFPLTGEVKCLVILSETPDDRLSNVPQCGSTSLCQKSYYEEMFFRDDPSKMRYYPGGSMREFYREISCGKFDFAGEIYGPYTLPNNVLYYSCGAGNGYSGCASWDSKDACLNPGSPGCHKYVEDLVSAADAEIDFSKFDSNNDGEVDCLIIVHPLEGAEQTCDANLNCDPSKIWSHFWWLKSPKYTADNQVFVYRYLIGPDISKVTNGKIEMGVYAHEFAHYLGLVDLYDRDFSSCGLGPYSLMAYGTHGYNPNHLDPLSLDALGWAQRTDILSNQCEFELQPVEEKCEILNVGWDGPGDNEFFLLEFRKPEGFDIEVPQERNPGFKGGILIYHVDLSVEKKFCGVNMQIDKRCNPINFCPMRNECEWCLGDSPDYHPLIDLEEPQCGCSLEKPGSIAQCDTLSSEDHFFTDVKNNLFSKDTCPSSRDYLDETGNGPYVMVRLIEENRAVLTIIPPGLSPEPPSFINEPPQIVEGGTIYNYLPEVTGTFPINFRLLNYPEGASVDPFTGKISWQTPEVNTMEEFSFLLEAKNCAGSNLLSWNVKVVKLEIKGKTKSSEECVLENLFKYEERELSFFRDLKRKLLSKGKMGKFFVSFYYSFLSPTLKRIINVFPLSREFLKIYFKIISGLLK